MKNKCKNVFPELRKYLCHPESDMEPAGGAEDFIDHPCRNDIVLNVAAVFEHRFALAYWVKWSREIYHKTARLPELISIDWHDDIGGESDYNPKDLRKIKMAGKTDISFFCWACMRGSNDGNIYPAIYLDAFSRAHVILKDYANFESGKRTMVDTFATSSKKRREVVSYRSIKDFLSHANLDSSAKYILDIDMDYFGTGGFDCSSLNMREIDRVADPTGTFLSRIFPNLCGVTIALEHHYCGGMLNALAGFFRLYNRMLGMREKRVESTKRKDNPRAKREGK